MSDVVVTPGPECGSFSALEFHASDQPTSANKHHSMPAHHCWTVILRSFYSGLFFRRDEYEGQGSSLVLRTIDWFLSLMKRNIILTNCSAACLGAIMLVFLVQWSRLAKRSRNNQNKNSKKNYTYAFLSSCLPSLFLVLFNLSYCLYLCVSVCTCVCWGDYSGARGKGACDPVNT